jgi:hypothetical protein
MPAKGLEPITFRMTTQEKARFRISCFKAGTTMQDVLAEFVRGKLRRGGRGDR